MLHFLAIATYIQIVGASSVTDSDLAPLQLSVNKNWGERRQNQLLFSDQICILGSGMRVPRTEIEAQVLHKKLKGINGLKLKMGKLVNAEQNTGFSF